MTVRFALAVVLGLAAPLAAQESPHFVSPTRVTLRVMKDVLSIDLAPGVHVRTVVGTTGSFSLGDFDNGGVAPLHHHTREQADFVVSRQFMVTLDNHVESVNPGAGFIVPANVSHSLSNKLPGLATVIEFHTVRRPDLVPPRTTVTFPASARPVPLDILITKQLDANPSGVSTLKGATCVMSWRRLKAGAAATPIHLLPTPVELFAYVVSGQAGLAIAGKEQPVGAGTLIVIPAAQRAVEIRAAGPADATVVEFSPAPAPKK